MAMSVAQSERLLVSVVPTLLESRPAPPPSAPTPAVSALNPPVAQGWTAEIPEAWLE